MLQNIQGIFFCQFFEAKHSHSLPDIENETLNSKMIMKH